MRAKAKAIVLTRERHRVVGKVTDDFNRNNFNTAISAVMELTNAAADLLRIHSAERRRNCEHGSKMCDDVAETLVKLLAPIAPHWAEELWHTACGHEDSVHLQPWPTYDPAKAVADEIELAVQVNGKIRAKIMVAKDAAKDVIEAAARAAVADALEGKTVVKAVVVPSRLVNLVIK